MTGNDRLLWINKKIHYKGICNFAQKKIFLFIFFLALSFFIYFILTVSFISTLLSDKKEVGERRWQWCWQGRRWRKKKNEIRALNIIIFFTFNGSIKK